MSKKRSNNRNGFINLLAVGVLVLSLIAGTKLVKMNQNPEEKASTTTWPSCLSLTDQATCTAWNCTWSRTYCQSLGNAACNSYSAQGCNLSSCTMPSCQFQDGCTYNTGGCLNTANSSTSNCYNYTDSTTCNTHSKAEGCYWKPPSCTGSTCKYTKSSTDPGFYKCSGYPSIVTSYSCDPNNVYVYRKNIEDGTASYYDTINCPSGQRCDLSSSSHCSSTRICTPGTKRCPIVTGREYSYYEQCYSDGFRWTQVNCPTGQFCDGSSPTFCKPAQICIPNATQCGSNGREIQKCNSAGSAWETIQSCYPEGTCRLSAYGPACS